MEPSHRLAAIMFTDIVGYTALMGVHQDAALHLLNKNRKLYKSVIKQYEGRCIKEMGDGILASFNTSSEAARCAGAMQNKAKEKGIASRIGII